MSPDRRKFVFALTTAVSAASLAACHKSILGPGHFDPKVMDKGFPPLAGRARPGDFAAAIMDFKTQATWYWNVDRPFPLGGLAVLPIAAALLAEVDARRVSLTEKITVRDVDLSPPYSLIGQSWRSSPANFAMNVTVQDLLALAVQYGDNTAADVLLARAGGPGAVTAWLRLKGIENLRVDRYAREIGVQASGMEPFRPAWRTPQAFQAAQKAVPVTDRQRAMEAYVADPRDTSSAQALMSFLFKLSGGQLTAKPTSDLLLGLMTPPRGSPGPMGAAWPGKSAWAHGVAAARSDLGFTPVQNDAGLVTLPDGRRFAVCALLAGSTASEAQRAQLFADTARLMVKAFDA
ncbi:MAG: serine hydrolase [Proteobacteria bacterium]|nr:serine hydrolase [Pseudomonadota bacterium]